MTIIELLMRANSSYLVALALLIVLIVEGVKASELVSVKFLPIVASGIGWSIGIVIGLIYQESLIMTSLNGIIAGLLAVGSFDLLKAVWRVPGEFK